MATIRELQNLREDAVYIAAQLQNHPEKFLTMERDAFVELRMHIQEAFNIISVD